MFQIYYYFNHHGNWTSEVVLNVYLYFFLNDMKLEKKKISNYFFNFVLIYLLLC